MATWLDVRTLAVGLMLADPSAELRRDLGLWDEARASAMPGRPALLLVPSHAPGSYGLAFTLWGAEGDNNPLDVMADAPALRAWLPSARKDGAPRVAHARLQMGRLAVASVDLMMLAAWDGNPRPAEGEPLIPELARELAA